MLNTKLKAMVGAVALLSSIVALPSIGQADDSSSAEHPGTDRQRGIVVEGLVKGRAGGPCRGGFESDRTALRGRCTPGPDPAPPGINVLEPQDLSAASTGEASATAGTGSVLCTGDGLSGDRVQAVYAVASDRVDRFSTVAGLIPGWAKAADAVFSASAAETGSDRHVRWVTNPDCSLSIIRVTLSPSADDTYFGMVDELAARGFDRTDRKYMVWTDANVYCGIGGIYGDDRPGPDNANNGAAGRNAPLFARVDSGCWGLSASVEAHELMHTMGGVQLSAPHSSGGWHCTDESDRMCYQDGALPMTYVCPSAAETRFDCLHDDYFHTSPAPGSYLDTHWNVANSAFLIAPDSATPPPADTTPPNAPQGLAAVSGDGSVMLSWNAGTEPDLAGYRLYRDGAASTVSSSSYLDTGLENGRTYTYQVAAYDMAGNESTKSAAVSATPRSATPVSATVSYTGSFTKTATSRSANLTVAGGNTTARVQITSTSGGRNSKPPSLTPVTLSLRSPDGVLLGQVSGTGSVTLAVPVSAGSHTWTVSGVEKSAYRLDITYLTPPA